MFYNDRAANLGLDEEFQKLWRSVAVESMDDQKIEEYLEKQVRTREYNALLLKCQGLLYLEVLYDLFVGNKLKISNKFVDLAQPISCFLVFGIYLKKPPPNNLFLSMLSLIAEIYVWLL